MKEPKAKTKKRTAKAVGATKPARQKSKNKAAMVSPTMTVPPTANEHELAVWRSRLLATLETLWLIKWEQEKWLKQEPVMLEQFFGLNEMDALRERINGMLVFLSDRDLSQMYFLPTGEQVAKHRVRRRLWMNSRTALHGLLGNTLNDLLWVIESRNTDVATECAEMVINVLLRALDGIRALYGNERTRKLFQQLAARRQEFPSTLSIFKKENANLQNFVLSGLQLGAELPFAVDPKKTYTPYTVLAMQIVNWIDSNRRNGWVKDEWRTADSIYRKIEPDLDKMPFHKDHEPAWVKVIAFHLDYFQSPRERREKTARKLDEFTERSDWLTHHKQREANNAHLAEMKRFDGTMMGPLAALDPFGEITHIPAFKAVLRAGKDKNATNDAKLYNRVKHKVIEAAKSLMPS